jgi:hypothetical protein
VGLGHLVVVLLGDVLTVRILPCHISPPTMCIALFE